MTTEHKKFTLELTEQEGSALLQLLDFAVKAQGLAIAGTAALLCQKIQTAHALSQQNSARSNSGQHPPFEDHRSVAQLLNVNLPSYLSLLSSCRGCSLTSS